MRENSLVIGSTEAYEKGGYVGVIFDVEPNSREIRRRVIKLTDAEIAEQAAYMADKLERNMAAIAPWIRMVAESGK